MSRPGTLLPQDQPTVDELLNPRSMNRYRVRFYVANGRVIQVPAEAVSSEALARKIMGLRWWVRSDEAGDVVGAINLTGCIFEIHRVG